MKDVKIRVKRENIKIRVIWGECGFSRSSAMSYSTSYVLFIENMYVTFRFRDIARYVLKVTHFSYPCSIWCPAPVGVTPLEFQHDLWHQKTLFAR